MTGLWQDVRYAMRVLSQVRAFTAVAVLILGLGIGANTAIFSFLDVLLLRLLPVPNPEELVVFGSGTSGAVSTSDTPPVDHFSYAQFQAIRQDNNGLFARVAAHPTFNATVDVGTAGTSTSPTETAQCMLVSGEYFELFGVRPFVGRLLQPSDDVTPGGHPVVVLGHRYWLRRFGGDPAVIGQTLRLQETPYRIVGITAPSFSGHVLDSRQDLFVPLAMQPQITRRKSMIEPRRPRDEYWLNILGRLKPGIRPGQAEASLNVRMQQIFLAEAGENVSADRRDSLRQIHIDLTPAGRGVTGLRDSLRTPLLLLWTATGIILLVACANLANLLLARAAGRRREMSIRLTLGAGRGRLVRQMLTESLLLAGMGSGAGVLVAAWIIPALEAMISEMRGPNLIQVGLDARVLTFAVGTGLLTVLLFGLAPALWSAGANLSDALKTGWRGIALTRGHSRAKAALVISQTALSVVLLTGAGLFLRTLGALRAADIGINPENVFWVNMNPRGGGLPVDSQDEMRRRIVDRVSAIPDVVSAAFSLSPSLSGNFGSRTVLIDGYEPIPGETTNAIHETVSPGYLATLGIALRDGRFFTGEDRWGEVCVVNEAFAERYFAGGAAVGGVVRYGDDSSPTARIIGVVGSVRQVNLRDDPPEMVYRTLRGYEGYAGTLQIRATSVPAATADAVRAAIQEIEPRLPVDRGFGTYARMLNRATTLERILSRLTAAFAALGLLLAALGLYGVMSYLVRQRTGEMGIRQALGATRAELVRMVLRQAILMLLTGAALGVVGALFAGRVVAGMLYGIQPGDPVSLGSALLVLVVAGLLAAYLPARRAARVSPMEALRYE